MTTADHGDGTPKPVGAQVSEDKYHLTAIEIVDDTLVVSAVETVTWPDEDRFPSMEDLVTDLSRFLARFPASDAVVAGLCYSERTPDNVAHLTHLMRGFESLGVTIAALETVEAAEKVSAGYLGTDDSTPPAAGVAAAALRTGTGGLAGRSEMERRITALLRNRIADMAAEHATALAQAANNASQPELAESSDVVRALQDHHRRELAELRAQSERKQAELHGEVRRLESRPSAQQGPRTDRSDATIAALRGQVETLGAARARLEAETERLRSDLDAVRETQPSDPDPELERDIVRLERSLSESTAEIRVLRSELDRDRSQADARLAELTQRHEQALRKVTDQHQLDVVRVTTQLEDRNSSASRDRADELETLRSELQQERSVRSSLQDEIAVRSSELAEAELAFQQSVLDHEQASQEQRASAAAGMAALQTELQDVEAQRRTRVNELEAALAQSEAQRREDIDALKREINRAVVERRQDAVSGRAALEETDRSVGETVNELKTQHEQHLAEVAGAHRAAVAKIETERDDQLDALKGQHRGELEDRRQAAEAELAAARGEHARRIASLRSEHTAKTASLREAFEASSRKATADLDLAVAERERMALERDSRPATDEVSELTAQIASLEQTAADQRSALEAATASLLASEALVLRQSEQLVAASEASESLGSESDEAMGELRASLAANAAALREANTQLDELRQKHTTEAARALTLDATVAELKATVAELRPSADALEKNADSLAALEAERDSLAAAAAASNGEQQRLGSEIEKLQLELIASQKMVQGAGQDLELAHRRNSRLTHSLAAAESTLQDRQSELAIATTNHQQAQSDARQESARTAAVILRHESTIEAQAADLARMQPPDELVSALAEKTAQARELSATVRELNGQIERATTESSDTMAERDAAMTRLGTELAAANAALDAEKSQADALRRQLAQRLEAVETLEADLERAEAASAEALAEAEQTAARQLEQRQIKLLEQRATLGKKLTAQQDAHEKELAATLASGAAERDELSTAHAAALERAAAADTDDLTQRIEERDQELADLKKQVAAATQRANASDRNALAAAAAKERLEQSLQDAQQAGDSAEQERVALEECLAENERSAERTSAETAKRIAQLIEDTEQARQEAAEQNDSRVAERDETVVALNEQIVRLQRTLDTAIPERDAAHNLVAELNASLEEATELSRRHEKRFAETAGQLEQLRLSSDATRTELTEVSRQRDQERLERRTNDDHLEELRTRVRELRGLEAEWEREARELQRAVSDAERLAELETRSREQADRSMAAQADELTRSENMVVWLRNELTEITTQRDEREAEFERLGGSSNVGFEAQIDDLESQVTESRARISALTAQLADQKAGIDARVREAFESASKLSDRAAVLAAERSREVEALRSQLSEALAQIDNLNYRLSSEV